MLIRLLRTYLRPYRRQLSLVLLLQLAQTIATLYLPTLNADIIDKGVIFDNTHYILSTGAVMVAITVGQIGCAVGAVFFGAQTAMALGRDLRQALFGRVQRFSDREVSHFTTPSLITRSTNDVQQVQMLAIMTFTLLLSAPIMCIGGIILALNQDVRLSSLLLVAVPLLGVLVVLIVARMRPLFRQMQDRLDAINRVLREQITGVRVIRAFVRDAQERNRFGRASTELFEVSLGAGKLMAMMMPSVMLVLNLSTTAVVWFGGHLIADGSMQIGSLTAFITYLAQILTSVMMATFMFMLVPRAEVSSERIMEVIDTQPALAPHPRPLLAGDPPGMLELRQVEFRYPGAEQPVLHDITFTALPGQTTAIIGGTGSGKTTLVNLVPRLIDVTAGSVLVGGVDVRELDPAALSAATGLVPQKPYLFSGTVATNLRYGNPAATDEELWQALEIAQARDFVERMPAGLNSPIAQGGTNVSGGQRQRLAIARALVHKAQIYLFDDSFSALDYATDARLRAALAADVTGATMMIVAQRVSTIRHADQIVVLDGGRIVAVGRHDELMDSSATYREIVLSQLTEQEAAGVSAETTGERATPQRGPRPAAGIGPGAGRGPGAFMGGMSTEKALDFKGSGRRLAGLLAPYRLLIAAALTCAVASVTLAVLGPRLLGEAINVVFAGVVPHGPARPGAAQPGAGRPGGVDFAHVAQILAVVVAMTIGSAICTAFQGRLTATMVQRTVFELRAQVQAKLSRLPLRYFDRQPRGEILSRVTNDMDNLQQSLQQTLSQLVTALFTIVGVLTLMFIVSWELALIALVTVPASGYAMRQIAKRAQPHFIRQWRYTGQLNGHIEEMYTGHALVTAFGRREQAMQTFTEQNEALYHASYRAQFISGTIQPVMMFVANLNYVLVAVVGGLLMAGGTLTLGAVTAFIQYSRQFSQPLTQVASMANMLQSSVASAERVFALLDATEQAPDSAEPARPADVRGRVEFDDVSFRYLPDQPLIERVSLRVEPGQTVAIVGPTGAGKTTLVNLLMRFYEIDSGQIRLDGVDTATMTRDELRGLTGMVLQDAWLFGGTIEENIAYGLAGATHDQVVQAARATYVDRFVRTLPDGYDTVLDDDGTNVSMGERQLITIARAFLARPAVLILDEATSSVDTRTEILIQRAMTSLRQGRTSFVIAHRLSTIRDADVILVMEDGQIVEQGTHAGLLAAGGAYARLYQAQFAQAMAEVV